MKKKDLDFKTSKKRIMRCIICLTIVAFGVLCTWNYFIFNNSVINNETKNSLKTVEKVSNENQIYIPQNMNSFDLQEYIDNPKNGVLEEKNYFDKEKYGLKIKEYHMLDEYHAKKLYDVCKHQNPENGYEKQFKTSDGYINIVIENIPEIKMSVIFIIQKENTVYYANGVMENYLVQKQNFFDDFDINFKFSSEEF